MRIIDSGHTREYGAVPVQTLSQAAQVMKRRYPTIRFVYCYQRKCTQQSTEWHARMNRLVSPKFRRRPVDISWMRLYKARACLEKIMWPRKPWVNPNG